MATKSKKKNLNGKALTKKITLLFDFPKKNRIKVLIKGSKVVVTFAYNKGAQKRK